MLLCDGCHRRIDVDEPDEHPEDLLLRYKREHEERIALLTGLAPDRKTQVVMLGANILDGKGLVNFAKAAEAILPARYPLDATGITLDLTRGSVSDSDPSYWPSMKAEVERYVATRLAIDVIGDSHVSLFAIAPIPVLVLFGRLVRNLRDGEAYQLHRDGTWKWRTEPVEEASFGPPPTPTAGSLVTWSLSVSGLVHDDEIKRTLAPDVAIYRMDVGETRSREWLRTREQLGGFRRRAQETLQVIRATHGANALVHVFPALPNSAAVELGRLLLPKSDPELLIYDNQRERGWVPTIRV
ncbi:MAG: SAVED domain-containing protein [Myxococcota bacterium]